MYMSDILLYFSFKINDFPYSVSLVNNDLKQLAYISNKHSLHLNPNNPSFMLLAREKKPLHINVITGSLYSKNRSIFYQYST